MPITVFGSVNQDLVTYTKKFPGPGETVHGVSFERHLGGKGFNEAIAIAKLRSPNDRFSVKLFGAVGSQDSKDFLDYLAKNNVSTNHVRKIDGTSTGTATIIVIDDDTGENRIIVVPGANQYLKPTAEELNSYFNPSNSLLNVEIPSTQGSATSPTGLVNRNGSIIHDSSSTYQPNTPQINNNASPLNSSSTTFYSNNNEKSSYDQLLTGSALHSHSTEHVLSSRITNSYENNDELPSELHAHASIPKMDTLTYPSPKPSSIDLQNAAITLASKAPIPTNQANEGSSSLNLTAQHRLTNVSFSLGGSSAHSSTTSLNPCQSYIQVVNKSRQGSFSTQTNPLLTPLSTNPEDASYFVVLQNEIPDPYFIINHIATNFSNVKIFYNPSPLPVTKQGYNSEFSNALHQSHYIIVNEHELKGIVDNFHSDPTRDPLSTLKNVSNFEPNSDNASIVNENINNLTKLRSLLTKPAIIVTLGGAGVLYSDVGKFSFSYIPSEDVDPEEIVDTTGAGDTFFGAMVTCIYRNETLESAIKFATKASAETIKAKGSAESMPFYKNVEKRGWLL